MSDKSKIEWTDSTWTLTTGCSKVTAGCVHCYAERMSNRLQAMGKRGYENVVNGHGNWTGQVNLMYENVGIPLRWKRGRRVFVDSMSDLFHEKVPFDFIADVFGVMCDERCEHHTFQVLTKRASRLPQFFNWAENYLDGNSPLSVNLETTGNPGANIWVGVSVEHQFTAEDRVHELLMTPAAVRFLSCGPLLGPVDLTKIRSPHTDHTLEYNALVGSIDGRDFNSTAKIDLVIVEGESGPGARPMNPKWVRFLRDQCRAAGVDFFFKQWASGCRTASGMAGRLPRSVLLVALRLTSGLVGKFVGALVS